MASKAPKVHGQGRHIVTQPGAEPVAYGTSGQAKNAAKQLKNSAVVTREDYKDTWKDRSKK